MFKDNMPAAQNEFDAIMSISQDIEKVGVHENPYTSLTKEVRMPNKFCLHGIGSLVISAVFKGEEDKYLSAL